MIKIHFIILKYTLHTKYKIWNIRFELYYVKMSQDLVESDNAKIMFNYEMRYIQVLIENRN